MKWTSRLISSWKRCIVALATRNTHYFACWLRGTKTLSDNVGHWLSCYAVPILTCGKLQACIEQVLLVHWWSQACYRWQRGGTMGPVTGHMPKMCQSEHILYVKHCKTNPKSLKSANVEDNDVLVKRLRSVPKSYDILGNIWTLCITSCHTIHAI